MFNALSANKTIQKIQGSGNLGANRRDASIHVETWNVERATNSDNEYNIPTKKYRGGSNLDE